jgi:putative oxidoreductase
MNKDLALLLLRLTGFGLAYAHGWPKVQALVGGQTRFIEGVANLGFPMATFFAWAAALAELGGGLFIALGFFTRLVAPFSACVVFVAAFFRHHAFQQLLGRLGLAQLSEETLKQWGNPELALVYLACFLAILLLGPGRLSLDHLFRGGTGKGRK